MTFGQILDRIFRLLQSTLRPYICIGLFTIGPFLLFYAAIFGTLYLAGFFQQPSSHPNVSILLFATLPLGLLFLPLMFLLYGLYYGASTYAALQADHGQPATAGQSIRHAWSRIGRYTWLMFLRSLIVAAPFIVCAAAVGVGTLLFGLTSKGNPNPGLLFLLIPLGVLLYLGGIVYAILMSLRLALAFPACVNENITAMQAIKRSGVLTQGAKGRIFLVALVIYAISYAGIMILYIVFAFSGAIVAFAGAGHWQRLGPAGYILLGILGLFALGGWLFSLAHGKRGIKLTVGHLIGTLAAGVAAGGLIIVGFYLLGG